MSEAQNDFFKMHRENKSIFVLVWRIIGLELGVSILMYTVSMMFIGSENNITFTYVFWAISIISLILGTCLLINWIYSYYIITAVDA